MIYLTWDYNCPDPSGSLESEDPLANKPRTAMQTDISSKINAWYWKANDVDKFAKAGDRLQQSKTKEVNT